MLAILKHKWGGAKSLDSAVCENKTGALSANQNAGLQCKINSANQRVVEWLIYHLSSTPSDYELMYDTY